jgi:two-component system, chemotaxis family, sensor kinase CheA
VTREQAWERELRERLHDIFVAEAAERLAAMDTALLALEGEAGGPDAAHHLGEAFRQAHTLKGGARAAGLPDVERVAHALESAFERLRSGEPGRPETWGAIYAATDAVKALVAGRAADVQSVVAALEEPGRPEATASPGPSVPPAAAPDGSGAGPASGVAAPFVRVPVARLEALTAEIRELHAVLGALRQRATEARALAGETSRLGRFLRHRRRRREAALPPAALEGMAAPPEGLELIDEMGRLRRRLDGDVHRLERVAGDLGETVRTLRMVPVGVALGALPRLVRDTAAACGKQVRLELSGETTEVDRSVVEDIAGVLAHLVRNAVDHGIEDPARRALSGKPATGVVTVAARQERATLTVEVSDDGDGIDEDAVRRRAVELGLVSPGLAAAAGVDLVFHPGFTTAGRLTEVSGRGVGLDAVRAAVEALQGSVTLRTELGSGTTVILTLPLTVATTRCLVLEAGGHRLALPLATVTRVERRRGTDDPGLPHPDLTAVLGLPPSGGGSPGLAVFSSSTGVLVDDIGREEELVVHALPAPLRRVRFTAGAAVLGTGELVPVLHAGEVFRAAAQAAPATVVAPVPAGRSPGPQLPSGRRVVVLAEVSVTTRTMERVILESAGYEVRTAGDGAQALALVQAGGCDALVSDVEMPVLDGFALCERLRADSRFQRFPVVLVTNRDDERDRERGRAAGADAYIVQGEFDQETLVATLRRLL